MKIIRSIFIGTAVCTAICAAVTAQAAELGAQCSFGNCSALIKQASFQVSCDKKVVYDGEYELATDFETTRIQAEDNSGPQIIIKGVGNPTVGAKTNSTLVIGDKSVAGICVLTSN